MQEDRLKSRFATLIGKLSDVTELTALRERFFKMILFASFLGALNGVFGPIDDSFEQNAVTLMRNVMSFWLVAHIVIYMLSRYSATWAYQIFLMCAFFVLLFLFSNLIHSPIERIAVGYQYHGAILFVALLLLPFRQYLFYSSVTTIIQLVSGIIVLHGQPPHITNGVILPLFVYWVPSLVAVKLLEYFQKNTIEARSALENQNIHLEQIVEQRTATIKKQQEHIFQAGKMNALGKLAGGIAHDFNNLLTAIGVNAQVIKNNISSESNELRGAASTIELATNRSAELTGQLLGIARQGKFQNTPTDLHQIIVDTVSILDRTLFKETTVTPRLVADSCVVVGDAGQLSQVFMNLVVNGKDAMPDGGNISLATSTQELSAEDAIEIGVAAGRYIVVAVTDTGTGIPDEIKEHIFEPFFTTKEQGRGTGLGLATSYGIAQNHGGTIRVTSELNKGTTFDVFIPLAKEGVTVQKQKRISEHHTKTSATVLVVDDEDVLRSSYEVALKHAGCKVKTAESGFKAVEYYKENHKNVDVVIIDMLMPEMDGKACYAALKEINPDIKVVISTGYAKSDDIQKILANDNVWFLQKPFSISQLSEMISDIYT